MTLYRTDSQGTEPPLSDSDLLELPDDVKFFAEHITTDDMLGHSDPLLTPFSEFRVHNSVSASNITYVQTMDDMQQPSSSTSPIGASPMTPVSANRFFGSMDQEHHTISKFTGTHPSVEPYSGPHNFTVDATEINGKKQWIYSRDLNKLYSVMGGPCPVKISVDSNVHYAERLVVRILPTFATDDSASEVVERCFMHANTSDQGFPHVRHLVRLDDQRAEYHSDLNSRRLSVVLPLDSTVSPEGTIGTVAYMKFMCLSSCSGGINRRPLRLIFTLEDGEVLLGRHCLELRICSCPKRDLKHDEALQNRSKVPVTVAVGKKRKAAVLETSDSGTPVLVPDWLFGEVKDFVKSKISLRMVMNGASSTETKQELRKWERAQAQMNPQGARSCSDTE